jgi:hypothetical protein
MIKIVDFPYTFSETTNLFIPMSDGTKLAAHLWLPDIAQQGTPVPAILEYIPYRKGDFTAERDSKMHRYFAGHGYASIRVDIRGSGESEGVLQDEYLQKEIDDGREVIRWLAKQKWCSGSVGMIGISWGGFNGLQIAATGEKALKGIVSVCSTDDRYADDVHYMGGCLLSDNLSWASTMFAYNSCPPDPEIVGEKWREMWLERLKGSGLWLKNWLSHQHRDDYWKHGSVCEDFSKIKCPVYAVSGWADGYSNAVFRLLKGLDVPKKGLIGAWGHKYPHTAVPSPAMGFLQECIKWWDQWLKGKETGIMEEPMLRVWMQGYFEPTSGESRRPGRWVGEDQWPSPHIQEAHYILNPGKIDPWDVHVTEAPVTIQSPLSVGLFAGKWCSYAAETDLPNDQREEDGGALVFDSDPLIEPLEILGAPEVDLELSVNKPVAQVAVRLTDIAPDDSATRVTYGILNLTHRNSHEKPEPIEVNRRYRVRVRLNEVAQSFPAGHSLRVAVSTSYWPLAWPSPEPVRMSVYCGVSTLKLPVRRPRESDKTMPKFLPAEGAEPREISLLHPPERKWTVQYDLATNQATLSVNKDDGRFRIEDNTLEFHKKVKESYSYWRNNYKTLRAETIGVREFKRGEWEVQTITRTLLRSTPDYFIIRADLDAYEGDARVYSQSWDEKIPRKLV